MPTSLANKIAAGEVVQRPASVLKELVENALDAGAGRIEVVLKQAGSDLIQVVDDGCGMSAVDAALCFERHATSKLKSIEDLERLQTLGFRGEALASVAAVARVEMRTRRINDAAGLLMRVEGGEYVDREPCAAPPGTSLAVRNLFYNVPARRSFLKSPATEFKHLVETFQFLALSHPGVAFILHHDDNEVYRLPTRDASDRSAGLKERIGDLFGKGHGRRLVFVDEATSYVSVHGLIGEPEFHRRSRGEQFLFVNGRYISNRYLEHAVRNAYDELLPDGAFPFFTLFLSIDPRHVDVNVHPTKAEVKFDDERGLYGFLRSVVRRALGEAGLAPQLDLAQPVLGQPYLRRSGPSPATPPGEPGSWNPTPARFGSRTPVGSPNRGGGGGEARPAELPAPDRRVAPGVATQRLYGGDFSGLPAGPSTGHPAPPAGPETPMRSAPRIVDAPEADRPKLSVLGQIRFSYILAAGEGGLYLIDQQRAHERVLFERALDHLDQGEGPTQQLLFPQTLDFAPADYELLKELLADLRALGFDLEPLSGRSVILRGVPADLRSGDERSVLDDVLQQYKANLDAPNLKNREALIRSMARRGAVRSGTRLEHAEMKGLVDHLLQCAMPYASPGGRPTLVQVTYDEIEKRFGR